MNLSGDEPISIVAAASMVIDYRVQVSRSDRVLLRANGFRPEVEGEYPTILNHGVYAKCPWVRGGGYEDWEPFDVYGQAFCCATRGTLAMNHAGHDRTEGVLGGQVSLDVGPDHPSHSLLPEIPSITTEEPQ